METWGFFATTGRKPTSLYRTSKKSSRKMALRVGSSMLLRSIRPSRASLISRRAMSEMAFTFATPNGVHYKDASVKQVDVPSFSGSFGILPDHVPVLAVLAPGVVTVIEESGDAAKFFVSSGTVTINDDSSVQILAEEAHSLDAFSSDGAKKALEEAQSLMNAAGDDAAKAEAQIAVEVADAPVKALAWIFAKNLDNS